MPNFDDVDALIGATDAKEEFAAAVDRGLGDELLDLVQTFGVESDVVRTMISAAAEQRGVDITDDGLVINQDELGSLIEELAYPTPDRKVFNWTADQKAFDASGLLASLILSDLQQVALTVMAVLKDESLALHPQHAATLVGALDQISNSVAKAALRATNPLQPTNNVVLRLMSESDIERTNYVGDNAIIDRGNLTEHVYSQVQAEEDRLAAAEEKVNTAIDRGTEPMEALRLISEEYGLGLLDVTSVEADLAEDSES